MECQVAMFNSHDAVTVAVKACASCNGGLLEFDKFCRWCGTRQLDLALNRASSTDPAADERSPYTTSALANPSALSGLRVSAVLASESAVSQDEQSRFVKRAILALISIPIWLIIVLLSPLDAYAAAKNLVR